MFKRYDVWIFGWGNKMRFWLILLIIFGQKALFGQNNEANLEQIKAIQQTIEFQIAENESLKAELILLEKESKNNLSGDKISPEDIAQKRAKLEQLENKINSETNRLTLINKNLEESKKQTVALQSLLQKQSNPLAENNPNIDTEKTRLQLNFSQNYTAVLQSEQQILSQTLALLKNQKDILETLYKRDNEKYLSTHQASNLSNQNEDRNTFIRLEALERKKEQLIAKKVNVHENREAFLDKNIELSLIGKQIVFENLYLELSSLDKGLQELQFADFSNVSLERIKKIRTDLTDTSLRYQNLEKQLKEQFVLNNEQFSLYARQRANIPTFIVQRQESVSQSYQRANNLSLNIKLNLDIILKNISKQYNVISTNYLQKRFLLGQDILLEEIFKIIPASLKTFAGQYVVAIQTSYHSLSELSSNRWQAIFYIFLIFILGTVLILSRINRIVRLYKNEGRLPFAKRLVLFIYSMCKYNLPYLVLLLLIYIIVHLTKLPAPSSYLIILVPCVFLAIAAPNFATKILVASQLVKTPVPKKVISFVTLFSAIGAILLALVMLSEWVLLENNESVTNIYRWLFGFYILLASYPIFIMIRKTWAYMNEYYEEFYLYRILKVLITLIPFGLGIFGVLSFLGYLNISWLFAQYFSVFMILSLFWAGYLAICHDISLWAKRYVLKNTSRGLFWTQDVINPIHTLLRYLGLFITVTTLLRLYEWDSHTPVIREIMTFLKSPIFGKEGSQFTTLNTILMSFLIYIIFKCGSWVRSLAYRWIFAKISDLGIRNSFSVFSQYAVVTLGFLLALNIIGIDLTAFTVFAGALGVGIGFGMQTIANNFISGLLLLIERPLRNGDIITVGNYEGRVERIGMRSLTITTFNNESVILPNSDFVTSAFMNWSHSDQVVRTILYLDISYKHNPEEVKSAFVAGLKQLVKDNYILEGNDFNFGVFAYDCSERGVRYRIQYFMNMDIHKLHDVRHVVVSTLWQVCFLNQFEIAYPKQEVYFPDIKQFDEVISKNIPPKLPEAVFKNFRKGDN